MTAKINSDGTFTLQYIVDYDELDAQNKLSPQRVVAACQNTAVKHSDTAGYTTQYFTDTHTAWVLSGWHIVFNNLPSENKSYDITTWTKPYKRLQADRNFLSKDENGTIIFKGMSRWFLIDTQKRKPTRLPSGFFDAYVPSEYENAFVNEDFKHHDLSIYTKISERQFKVTRRDIDSNDHTNNVSYIIWAIDDLPDEIYRNMTICELRAEYHQEAIINNNVKSEFYIREIEDNKIEATSVFSNADDNTYFCRITTKWHLLK